MDLFLQKPISIDDLVMEVNRKKTQGNRGIMTGNTQALGTLLDPKIQSYKLYGQDVLVSVTSRLSSNNKTKKILFVDDYIFFIFYRLFHTIGLSLHIGNIPCQLS
ncbi:MAG TPA: hypothetical protein VE445_09125 [Nitrososphaeraceae archaeon]|nr:hypothetical protein [Nitrososphaeraceae archaeon]